MRERERACVVLFTYLNASVSNKRENVCEKNKEKENKGEILSKLKKSGNERLFERLFGLKKVFALGRS